MPPAAKWIFLALFIYLGAAQPNLGNATVLVERTIDLNGVAVRIQKNGGFGTTGDGDNGLNVREDQKKGVYVENLGSEQVDSSSSAGQVLLKGYRNRRDESPKVLGMESNHFRSINLVASRSLTQHVS